MSISAGTVTTWDGMSIVNGTNRHATTYTGQGQVALPRLYQLGTGVWVNYDSSGDSAVAEGQITQEFIDSSGHTFLDLVVAKLGQSGSLTIVAADEIASLTNDVAMLIKIIDTTPVQGNRNSVWGQLTWQILGAWT
jgi:hypothetical protein